MLQLRLDIVYLDIYLIYVYSNPMAGAVMTGQYYVMLVTQLTSSVSCLCL